MASPTKSNDPYLGTLINERFLVEQLIARGAMSRIYRAKQLPLDRTVALKVLDKAYTEGDEAQFRQRFFLEASLASKLIHPNTVTIFDYGRTEDGTYFIAMEYVEGESLRDVVRRDGSFSPQRVVHVAKQIAQSLEEAHRLHVVHRDLRPANVLIARQGDIQEFVKVLDFGLVQPAGQDAHEDAQTGVFLGSPRYMAPEQIRGEAMDERTDIYALGVVMYELVTGAVPFDHEASVKALMAHLHSPVPALRDPSLPLDLVRLIHSCLSKRPENRPTSMDRVIATLKQVGRELGQASTPTSAPVTAMGESEAPTTVPSQTPGRPTRGSTAFPPGASAASRLPRTQSRTPLVRRAALLIGAAAAAAGLLLLPTARDGAPSQDSPAAGKPAAGDSGRSRRNAPVAAPAGAVLVHVTSAPAGALVAIDGVAYGQTPALIELRGGSLAEPREILLELSLPGHQSVRLARTLTTRRLEIHAALASSDESAPRVQEAPPQAPP